MRLSLGAFVPRARASGGFGLGLALTVCACGREPAPLEACTAILDRIVAIELREQGYRDPELLRRKQAEARTRFEAELKACVGRPLPAGALACIAHAADTETLTHTCLRGSR